MEAKNNHCILMCNLYLIAHWCGASNLNLYIHVVVGLCGSASWSLTALQESYYVLALELTRVYTLHMSKYIPLYNSTTYVQINLNKRNQ